MGKAKIFNARKYMQMAIETMHNSINEPRSDGKISPLVGAILVTPDGTVETACRGELRYGDHAEFTLLERKLRDKILDGSILFATLEPCAPGSRKHPKLGCAERIVNARIKEVWIGLEDPDPDVDRKGIKFLQQHGIKVHMFNRDLQKQILLANKNFLKQARQRASEQDKPKKVVLSNIERPLTTVEQDAFSPEAINFYLKKSKRELKVFSPEFWNHFESIGMVERSEVQNKIVIRPTGFGVILFGKKSKGSISPSSAKGKS
jgi:ATP-dependent DNA helicase RecG